MDHYRKPAPRLARWAEENLLEGFTVFQFPEEHRRKIRTSNGLERVNRAIKQRTRVAGLVTIQNLQQFPQLLIKRELCALHPSSSSGCGEL